MKKRILLVLALAALLAAVKTWGQWVNPNPTAGTTQISVMSDAAGVLVVPSTFWTANNVLNGAAPWTADNLMLRSDGTANTIQDTGITIDDLDNMSGIGNITYSGTLSGTIDADTLDTLDSLAFGQLALAQTIAGNWVNTANPWAENELVSTVLVETDVATFAALDILVADKGLINLADVATIAANWVNTANPWADNEVADTLTIGAGSTVADGALGANVAHVNVVETISANWVNTANPWADNEVADTLTIGAGSTVADGALSANVALDNNNTLTDHALLRGDTGNAIQDTGIIVDDANAMTLVASITIASGPIITASGIELDSSAEVIDMTDGDVTDANSVYLDRGVYDSTESDPGIGYFHWGPMRLEVMNWRDTSIDGLSNMDTVNWLLCVRPDESGAWDDWGGFYGGATPGDYDDLPPGGPLVAWQYPHEDAEPASGAGVGNIVTYHEVGGLEEQNPKISYVGWEFDPTQSGIMSGLPASPHVARPEDPRELNAVGALDMGWKNSGIQQGLPIYDLVGIQLKNDAFDNGSASEDDDRWIPDHLNNGADPVAGMRVLWADDGDGLLRYDDMQVITEGVSLFKYLYVNAGAMIPFSTVATGAGVETLTLTATGDDIMIDTLTFDTATEEGAGFWITFPEGWNAGTVQVKFHWTAPSGTTAQTVKWDVAAQCYADSAAIDQALGTEQTVTENLITLNDMHISGKLGTALTIADAAPGEPIWFEITRDVGTDTMDDDAHLIGVVIEYQVTLQTSTAW